MGSDQGWIKLHRQIMETPEWLSEPFTRGQAWVDLLLLANHETGFIRKRGILIAVERGQVGYSERTLAERWQWSRNKVRRFFAELIRVSRISYKISEKTIPKKTSVSALIYILNYGKYQMNDTENDTKDDTENDTRTRMKRIKRNNMSDSDNSGFNLFYQKYPKHEGKKKALDAWKKLNPNENLQSTILKAIENQIQHKAKLKASNAFCSEWPLPASWLNGRRWEDEITENQESNTSW